MVARLTCLFLLKGDVTPTCNFCQTPLSIKHIVLELSALNASRQCFYSERSLMDDLLLFFKSNIQQSDVMFVIFMWVDMKVAKDSGMAIKINK